MGQGLRAPAVNVTINARDAESFRQSRTQVAADIARAVSLGRRGNVMAFHESAASLTTSAAARAVGRNGGPRSSNLPAVTRRETPAGPTARRRYDVAYGIRRADDLAAVVAFFEARNGRLHGFRYKDWADYKSSLPSQPTAATDQQIGTGTGSLSPPSR